MKPKHPTHDLTDDQWELVAPLIPAQGLGGRPRVIDMRAVVNAILHLKRTGCVWRKLPNRYPNHASVRTYHDRWQRDGTWARICEAIGFSPDKPNVIGETGDG